MHYLISYEITYTNFKSSSGTPGVNSAVGLNMPPAPELVVSLRNLSAMIVTLAWAIFLLMLMAVDNPTTPAPRTAMLTILLKLESYFILCFFSFIFSMYRSSHLLKNLLLTQYSLRYIEILKRWETSYVTLLFEVFMFKMLSEFLGPFGRKVV